MVFSWIFNLSLYFLSCSVPTPLPLFACRWPRLLDCPMSYMSRSLPLIASFASPPPSASLCLDHSLLSSLSARVISPHYWSFCLFNHVRRWKVMMLTQEISETRLGNLPLKIQTLFPPAPYPDSPFLTFSPSLFHRQGSPASSP